FQPDNLLFVEEDTVKLCDLGIATVRRPEGASNTLISRTHHGTPMYMSPEQLSLFGQYSSKSDVFALGLILAELCLVLSKDERNNVILSFTVPSMHDFLQIFDNYRKGEQCDLFTDAETKEFVGMLTQVDPTNRPTCQEMLDHPYLS
ncbi:hypothetical protein PENTCL1PPCAC_3716, partial [Pristionchus entomophagus]